MEASDPVARAPSPGKLARARVAHGGAVNGPAAPGRTRPCGMGCQAGWVERGSTTFQIMA
eukprot:1467667-Alexandrium_andersonii.AAC.1